jgi:hypothetical protein
VRDHTLNLRLITRQLEAEDFLRPRAIHHRPLRRLVSIQRPHAPGGLVWEIPLHNVDRVVPRRASEAPATDQEVLAAGDPGIQGEDFDLGHVINEDRRARVGVRVFDPHDGGECVAVRAFGAHFGDRGRELVGADDEAGHDVDDVEMGLVVGHEFLRGAKGADFGCCVGIEGIGVWGMGGGDAHFVYGNVRDCRRSGGRGEEKRKKRTSEHSLGLDFDEIRPRDDSDLRRGDNHPLDTLHRRSRLQNPHCPLNSRLDQIPFIIISLRPPLARISTKYHKSFLGSPTGKDIGLATCSTKSTPLTASS